MVRQRFLIYLNALCFGIIQSAVITVYEPRRRCPNTEEKWRERVEGYICPSQTKYHCMLTGDGEIVEFCSDITWIEHDYCPMFNSKTGTIDVQLCPENGDCPRKQYLSNTVYNYPDCLQVFRKASDSKDGGISLASTAIEENSVEPSYNVTAIDALRLTSISMVFMAISFFLFIAVFIVLIILLYIHVRKGMNVQNLDQSDP
ncbi:uncharacterized protein LOC128187689 [Crassostrea angulata]|uniref:uncharacterized protein LOC128187689 n=1 Tax=Magallana angulata TaxID=2784310 RepID=UPI0022B10705|nr:uncharacterized protein LOC128187689 [Crassostrea angulata]